MKPSFQTLKTDLTRRLFSVKKRNRYKYRTIKNVFLRLCRVPYITSDFLLRHRTGNFLQNLLGTLGLYFESWNDDSLPTHLELLPFLLILLPFLA
jgi:hypothetical protein